MLPPKMIETNRAASLPSPDEMYRAVTARDPSYEGVFVLGVRTTGIFCRPGCPARTPKRANVQFFPAPRDAVLAGYRPCSRCRPLEPSEQPPEWLSGLLEAFDADPARRWRDADLRELGLEPARVRRWFQKRHGLTFHAYARSRRLAAALGQMRDGDDATGVAFDHGYESLSGFRDAFGKLFQTTPGRSAGARVLCVDRIATPLGPMLCIASDDGVCLLEFMERRMLVRQIERVAKRTPGAFVPQRNSVIEALICELGEYFAGTRQDFEVPLEAPGSPFQGEVWRALRQIPYGETRTYAQLATELGRERAQRAVGRANGDNRIAIIVPCHRVIRTDGALGGYGGLVWRKQALLELERGAMGVE